MVGFFAAFGLASGAYAAGSCSIMTCPTLINNLPEWSFQMAMEVEGQCQNSTTTCYSNGSTSGRVSSCGSCKYPYTRVAKTVDSQYCSNSITYYQCVCQCSNCTTSAWADVAVVNGTSTHQARTVATCSCSSGTAQCTKKTEYRCRANYYGRPSSSGSGCTQCPTETGVATKSNLGDNYDRTDCYIPKNTNITDSYGTYYYTDDCHLD